MSKVFVKNGVDTIEKNSSLFEGKRLGLITNQTGVDKTFTSTIDIIGKHFNLTTLYSPEHGLNGNYPAGCWVDSYVDRLTGLPVFSLYGKSKKPSAEMLGGIDILIYDIQDIGSRYYTFIYTMAFAMESCAVNNKTFVVFDRINPVGGKTEGNILDSRFSSFVGLYPLPVRYGLTVGELAQLFNEEYKIGAHLEIVKVEGWNRDLEFNETDLFWINPTLNMNSPDSALLYCGTCLFEGTNLSEGRGTTKPFEMIGAPWIDSVKLADAMNRKGLKGIHFRPCTFKPDYSKYYNTVCEGVYLHVTDKEQINPFECGVLLLAEIRDMYRHDFLWNPPKRKNGNYFIDLLAGTDELRLSKDYYTVLRLIKQWDEDCRSFQATIDKYKLYG